MSSDPEVRLLAWDNLETTTRVRPRRQQTLDDMRDFRTDRDFRDTHNLISSIWTKDRSASGRLGISWHISSNMKVILYSDKSITDKRKVFDLLREYLRISETYKLRQAKNQGKINECIAAHKAFSHYIRTGDYLRFTDWNFIHATRLGVLKTNATMPGRQQSLGEQQCRWWSFRQTIPYLLNHCKVRLRNTITENRTVSSLGSEMLPVQPGKSWR